MKFTLLLIIPTLLICFQFRHMYATCMLVLEEKHFPENKDVIMCSKFFGEANSKMNMFLKLFYVDVKLTKDQYDAFLKEIPSNLTKLSLLVGAHFVAYMLFLLCLVKVFPEFVLEWLKKFWSVLSILVVLLLLIEQWTNFSVLTRVINFHFIKDYILNLIL